MAPNLLEQLAELEVPPPPPQFDAQLHENVNRALLATQIVDLFVSALPWALLQFGQAFLGFVSFTVTGKYPPKSKRQRR